MLIDTESLHILLYISIYAIAFLFGLIILRKQIWNLFDPLILMLFNVSFNVANVVYFGLNGETQYQFIWFVIVAYVFFLLGLNANFINRIRIGIRKSPPRSSAYIGPTRSVTIYIFLVTMLFNIASTAFVFYNVGFAIITNEISPDVKATMTLDHFGIFKYISWAGATLLIPVIAHAFYIHKLKLITYIGIAWFLVTSFLFNFSKAGFFFLMFDIGIVLYYFDKKLGYKIISYKKLMMFGLLGLIPAYFALSYYRDTTGNSIAMILLDRFIDNGGGTYNYFVHDGWRAFEGWDFTKRIIYYFDTILSVFRFKSWEGLTLINVVQEYVTGNYVLGMGQNPFLFFDGHFLFGWFGIFYAFAIGLLINYVRNLNVNIIFFYFLIKAVFPIVGDPDMTQAYIVSMVLLVPFIIFIYMIGGIADVNILKKYPLLKQETKL